jgi:hypothetical protein
LTKYVSSEAFKDKQKVAEILKNKRLDKFALDLRGDRVEPKNLNPNTIQLLDPVDSDNEFSYKPSIETTKPISEHDLSVKSTDEN